MNIQLLYFPHDLVTNRQTGLYFRFTNGDAYFEFPKAYLETYQLYVFLYEANT